jgi:hypothetical protein
VKLNESGKPPLGLEIADYSRVRSLADTNIPKGESWQPHLPNNLGISRKALATA